MPAGAGLAGFCALAGGKPEFHPDHPLGCHRRRVPGPVDFGHVVAALMHGSGYERIATPGCSTALSGGGWAHGPGQVSARRAGDCYGIPLGITSAGANRHDFPLPARTLQATERQLDGVVPEDRTCHLTGRGYDSTVARQLLEEPAFDGQMAPKGIPAPIQADTRRVVERTHSWMNGYGKLRRCTWVFVCRRT